MKRQIIVIAFAISMAWSCQKLMPTKGSTANQVIPNQTINYAVVLPKDTNIKTIIVESKSFNSITKTSSISTKAYYRSALNWLDSIPHQTIYLPEGSRIRMNVQLCWQYQTQAHWFKSETWDSSNDPNTSLVSGDTVHLGHTKSMVFRYPSDTLTWFLKSRNEY